ncbi:MAG: gamma-glutamyl-gamma-aminobutyrate hydrolase family protein, partial [Bacteroidota bacterium]
MNHKKIISATLKQTLVLFILLIATTLVITPLYAKNKSTLKIGLTKGKATENNERYIKWLKSINPKIEIIEIYPMGRAAELQKLDSCDGLLLSGGDDIFPGRYGQPADTVRCQLEPPRDTMEFFLIEKAVA